jgi:hypothetical protein
MQTYSLFCSIVPLATISIHGVQQNLSVGMEYPGETSNFALSSSILGADTTSFFCPIKKKKSD